MAREKDGFGAVTTFERDRRLGMSDVVDTSVLIRVSGTPGVGRVIDAIDTLPMTIDQKIEAKKDLTHACDGLWKLMTEGGMITGNGRYLYQGDEVILPAELAASTNEIRLIKQREMRAQLKEMGNPLYKTLFRTVSGEGLCYIYGEQAVANLQKGSHRFYIQTSDGEHISENKFLNGFEALVDNKWSNKLKYPHNLQDQPTALPVRAALRQVLHALHNNREEILNYSHAQVESDVRHLLLSHIAHTSTH